MNWFAIFILHPNGASMYHFAPEIHLLYQRLVLMEEYVFTLYLVEANNQLVHLS